MCYEPIQHLFFDHGVIVIGLDYNARHHKRPGQLSLVAQETILYIDNLAEETMKGASGRGAELGDHEVAEVLLGGAPPTCFSTALRTRRYAAAVVAMDPPPPTEAAGREAATS